MPSRRVLKAAEAIREVVSTTILIELQDPRIQDVTVTYVEVSPDMRQAKVHVSVMGDDAKQKLSLHGLQSAAGYLQSKIASRIDTRYTPRLQFVLDQGVKHSIEVSRILSELFPNQSSSTQAGSEAADHEGDDQEDDDQEGEQDDEFSDEDAGRDSVEENPDGGDSGDVNADGRNSDK